MIILITGDRNWTNGDLLFGTLDEYLGMVTMVVEGCARGADELAERWADSRDIPVDHNPAHWRHGPRCEPECREVVGRPAGPIRNRKMIKKNPDLVIAFHPDLAESKGTRDMVAAALEAGAHVRYITGETT